MNWTKAFRAKPSERPVRKSLGVTVGDFVRSFDENSTDSLPHLVFADLVEEGGNHGAAELIRRHFEDMDHPSVSQRGMTPRIHTEENWHQGYDPAKYPPVLYSRLVKTGIDGPNNYLVGFGARVHDKNEKGKNIIHHVDYTIFTSPQEAHRLLSGMTEGVENAASDRRLLEQDHPELRQPKRKPKGGTK